MQNTSAGIKLSIWMAVLSRGYIPVLMKAECKLSADNALDYTLQGNSQILYLVILADVSRIN